MYRPGAVEFEAEPAGVNAPSAATENTDTSWSLQFAVASSLPDGLNVTEPTNAPLVWDWPSGRGRAGSATSHSWIVLPPLPLTGLVPLASVCPSGLNATESTNSPLVWG